MSDLLRVRNWCDRFEVNRSREIAKPSWFPMPIDLDSDQFTELVDHPDGAAHLGAWLALLTLASRCSPRGTLIRDGGRPHDAASISRITRLPGAIVDAAILRLLSVGWLEVVADVPHQGAEQSHPSAALPHVSAEIPQDGAVQLRKRRGEEKREKHNAPDGAELFELSPERPSQDWRHQKFSEFWSGVWAKIGVGAARTVWFQKVTTVELADRIITAARLQGPALKAAGEQPGRTVLHPRTWLSQERWEDDLVSDPSKTGSGDRDLQNGSTGMRDLLPAELDVERLLLGVCLTQPESLSNITDQLKPDDFYLEPHRRIFNMVALMAAGGRHVDHVTVARALDDAKQLESIGGVSYLIELDSALPRIFDVDSYLSILKRKAILRQAAQRANLLAESICAGQADIAEVEEAQRWLESLAASAQSPRDGLLGLEEHLQASGGLQRFLEPPVATFVPTPWPTLNSALAAGGFGPEQLVIVAARPGIGKTALGVNLAIEASRKGHGAAVFSLEMNADELWRRAITVLSGVRGGRLARGGLSEQQRRAVHGAMTALSEVPIWIDAHPTATVGSIVSRVERHRARGNSVGIVIVDYLQLLTVSARSRRSRVEEVTEISRLLKLAAKRLKVPIVVMAQINRDSVKENVEPELHHLRESGSVEQDADTVLMLHQDPKDRTASIEEGTPSPITMLLRKQRNGPTGRFRMTFDFAGMRMTDAGHAGTQHD